MTSRLKSSAVTNQRAAPQDSLDYFPTPPWATRAVVEEVIIPAVGALSGLVARDPACGELHMVVPLRDYFATVDYADVHDWGVNPPIRDFSFETRARLAADGEMTPAWVFTNPPFNLAFEFIQKALAIATEGVAMFVRIGVLPGQARYREIYRDNPPTFVCIFAERVALIEKAWDPEASTATDYIWLVWIKGMEPQPPYHFAPGRAARHTRATDLDLAKPGEAARRKKKRDEAKRELDAETADQPDMFGGAA